MAKTQNEHVKSHDKNQENHLPKGTSLIPQIDQDLDGSYAQLSHAVHSPDRATPGSIQLLQEKFGNNEVRRIVQSEQTGEPIVDHSRNLRKHISDEIQRARGGGQPLESQVSSQVKEKFGQNFENVRLHSDHKSDRISRQIQAKAFTVGNDIFFRKGAFAPQSEQGRQTLMHELTHVAQQSSSSTSSGPLKLGEPDNHFEREADQIAKSQPSSELSGSALAKGVVQRSIFTGAKQKIGGLFGSGGKKTPAQPTTPAPALSLTTSPLPKGLTQENWDLLQQAGVKNETEWKTLVEDKKVTILSLITQNPELAKKLITAENSKQWPTDDKGKDIFDTSIIASIDGTLKLTLDNWKKVKDTHKASLITLNGEPYITELANLASENKWPKDGDDKDITQKDSFDKIQKFGLSLTKWNVINNKDHRKFLLENADEKYIPSLINQATTGKWPTDGQDKDITTKEKFEKIVDKLGIDFVNWNNIQKSTHKAFLLGHAEKDYIKELSKLASENKWPQKDNGDDIRRDDFFSDFLVKCGISINNWILIQEPTHRKLLLDSKSKLNDEQLKELGNSVMSGNVPKDGTTGVIDADKWKTIKETFEKMVPAYWNGIEDSNRSQILAEPDKQKRIQLFNNAKFDRQGKETKLEKAGGIASHPGFDIASGTLGTTSGILGASKGTGDNPDLDRASGVVGATGDLLSMGTSTTQLLGSASKISRGKKMANDPNSSLAMKALGRKEMSKGKWGVAQSTFGLAGSTASLGGNLTKSIDPESQGAKDTSSGFGVASGFLGMFGSGLGLGKGSASMHSARKRSNLAKGFVKTAGTGQTLSAEEQKMNEIAQFTSKNQNKTGKGLGIFKSVTSFLGSAVNTIGSIGSLAGLGNEAGLGFGIAGAALSGVGVLGGIGQWAAESKGKPKDADVEAQAMNLISLLRLGDPKGKEAAKFVQTVLKIDLVKVDDPNTWSNWIDEDEKAAVALIKSKLSKF